MCTIEDLCGMCIIIYTTTEKDMISNSINKIKFKKTDKYKNLSEDMQKKDSIINYYSNEFNKMINKIGQINGSYEFFVDYKQEKEISNLIKNFCKINELECVMALITGSRYLGNDDYESVAYTINFN